MPVSTSFSLRPTPTATEVSGADLDRCLGIYDRRARAEQLGSWTAEQVLAPAHLRLYCAVVSQFFILHPDRDVRTAVDLDH